MDLVNIDTIGPQSTEGIFDLFLNPSRRRIAEYFSIFRPLQADFGCENRMVSAAAFRQCLAHNFLGSAKTIHCRRVNEIDALVHCMLYGGDGLGLLGPPPEPTADCPSTQTDARKRCGNVRTTNRFCNHKMDYSIFGGESRPTTGYFAWFFVPQPSNQSLLVVLSHQSPLVVGQLAFTDLSITVTRKPEFARGCSMSGRHHELRSGCQFFRPTTRNRLEAGIETDTLRSVNVMIAKQ